MVTVEKINTESKAQVRRFVNLPFQLNKNDSMWVPPIRMELTAQLNRTSYPFYEHSDADFFVAVRDKKDVGRIAAIENRRFNRHHGSHKAQFYFFECVDDQEVATALFDRVFDWARARGLDTVIGPKGLSALDAYGIQIDGFELRTMMTMMNYNPPYYARLLENLGFIKEVDFLSCYIDPKTFTASETVNRIAERVQKRGYLTVHQFHSIRELKEWAPRIGSAYNNAFINNWEYYPLTEREIAYVVNTLQTIADPRLIKIILHDQEAVGFIFAFPDIASAVQRTGGRLFPFGFVDLMLEMRRSNWVAVNTAGILPEYHGHGGNVLLYTELLKTIQQRNFEHAAVYQVAETAKDMRRDLEQLGEVRYKNHRVFVKQI